MEENLIDFPSQQTTLQLYFRRLRGSDIQFHIINSEQSLALFLAIALHNGLDPTLFKSLVKYSSQQTLFGLASTSDALLVNKLLLLTPSPSQGNLPFCHSKMSMSAPNIQLSQNHKLSNV